MRRERRLQCPHHNPVTALWARLTRRKCCSDTTGEPTAATAMAAPLASPPHHQLDEEEEEEEEVKVSAEKMREMSLSARPHTQIDYVHHLVPCLARITACTFYWGKMDRYQAEALLDSRPEGSFLLRDSAQDEFLFSVSFRRYGRSLHARIEEQGHKFSFDCHDPGVFMSRNIPELLDHYKDPASCMFFEPMLCRPVLRREVFSLQSLARAVICDRLTSRDPAPASDQAATPGYSDVDKLELPKSLKIFLKEYHYRHKTRVRRYDI